MTVWHLRDLSSGKKKRLKSALVEEIGIPQFEGLSIEKMLEFAKNYPKVNDYLPVPNEIHKLPR